MAYKQITAEYLGDINAEPFLQNLTNTNKFYSTISEIREFARAPFKVVAEYEYEWQGDPAHPLS
jgi:hypothetical protein